MTEQPEKVGLERRLLATGYDRDNFPRMDSEGWLPVGLAREAAAEITSLRTLLDETVREREQYNGWHQAAVMEVDRLRAECAHVYSEYDLVITQRDQLLAALNLVMIGGDHVATVLIGRLGGGFAAQYPPDLDHEIALRRLGATDEYDVWCCWAAIMTARAAVEDSRD